MADITELFHGDAREPIERNSMCERMERCAGVQAQNFANDLVGYVMLAVNAKGEWSLGFGVDAVSPLGVTMLAGLAMGAIQKDMLSESAVSDALIRNGLVLPPKKPEA